MRLMVDWKSSVWYKVWLYVIGYLLTYHVIDDEMTKEQKKSYDQLLQEKLDIIDERDQLVQQLEEDRLK